jgi:hypothetical protein
MNKLVAIVLNDEKNLHLCNDRSSWKSKDRSKTILGSWVYPLAAALYALRHDLHTLVGAQYGRLSE